MCRVPWLADRPPSDYQPTVTPTGGQTEEEEEYIEPYFGDLPGLVHPDHFRIAGININNLPLYKNDGKNEQLFQAITQYDIDITLFQEVGINWHAIPRSDTWKERVKEWVK